MFLDFGSRTKNLLTRESETENLLNNRQVLAEVS